MKNSKRIHNLKRTLAFVSALSMIGSFSQTIGAFTALATYDVSTVSLDEGSNNKPTGDSNGDRTENKNYSKIDIEITNQLDFENDVDCTVSIFKENEYTGSDDVAVLNEKLTVGGSRNSSSTISTGYIENGKYFVEIKAPGFKPFIQEISDFNNMVCTLKVTIGFNSLYTYVETQKTDENGELVYNSEGGPVIADFGKNHPGVLLVGDVNGDGAIDTKDREILLASIDYAVKHNGAVQDEYKDMTTDLTHDGKTNLADLTLFAKSFIDTDGWDTTATVEKELSEEYKINSVKEVKALDKTVSTGASIQDLIKQSINSSSADSEEGEDNQNSEETAPKTMQLAPQAITVINEDTGEEETVVPEISEDHPVGFDLELNDAALSGFTFGTNASSGTILIETSNGVVEEVSFNEDALALGESSVTASVDADGNISLDLGGQIAVKKITLKITSVKNTALAEIATVEFLNGMEERISAPEPDYPVNVKVSQPKTANKDAKITATWDKCVNISGYEFEVSTSSATKADGSFVSTIPGEYGNSVETNTFSLQSEHGNFKLIKTNTTYYVHVRTVAEGHRSKWSETSKIVTQAFSAPDKPDGVTARGGFQSLKVSWGADNTNSTTNYDVYYRRTGKDENEKEYEWNKIENIGKTTNYEIIGLEDLKEYEVYVIGKNAFGDSPQSVWTSATTTTLVAAQMPNYNVINRDSEGKPGSSHIISVTRNGGQSIGNDKDNDKTAWCAVDGDATSYYSKATWDDGGFNNLGSNGLTYTFDKEYTMDTIGILTTTSIDYTHLRWWDEDDNQLGIINNSYANISARKTDSDGRYYYVLKFSSPITASKIQIGLARYLTSPITISETYFYHYDSSMDEIMDLYVDDLHTVLKDYVTQETIDTLRKKVNTPDEVTGELNPNLAALERELVTAEKILNAEQLSQPVVIHNSITTKDTGRNFSGLNAWQPLGVTIGTNEEVTIYVGSNTKKTGEGTDLRLICTQYNSESGGVSPEGANLVVGANTFKLTKANMAGAEAGGALYIQYQGDSNSDVQYSVRVTGGSEVPILDLYNVTDDDERWYRAYDYIEALDKYVANMEEEHNKVHKGAKTYNGKLNTKLDYEYNEKTCILGATDVLCDKMMYSLPAPQVLAGLGKGSTEERAEILIRSMSSMEEMMTLFYQHKGISPYATNEVDQTPKQHLNIRYQRMFSGAAMYAAGNHIGIQWGSAPGMFNSKGVTSDENGKYVSGSYFGWGIAHEIGHCLNDSSYTVAEITNNYFSLLSQAQDKNAGSRLNYNNIFKKVTSNTKGSADQGTQLGMYWQLHLAYDKDYNYKTYNTKDEILNSLFYARMDTYSRTPSNAPKPGGIALTLNDGTDQNLMRLACAASEKNVLEFFERWGKTPNDATRSYASQFETEKRAIMYANEDSRVYSMKGEGSSLISEDGKAVSVIDNVSVKVGTGTNANKVNLSISVSDKINAKDILGYEIIRCTISNGDVKEVPIGFATSANFTDTVTVLNNRTVSYKVTLIDQYLNRSEVFATDMVKVQHDGSIDKAYWSISTSGLAAEAVSHEATEDELPCEVTIIDPATAVIDDNFDTVYAPNVTNNTAEIVMNFNQTFTITGMKYTAGNTENSVGKYKVYITENGADWIEVANGTFNGSETVYFSNTDNKYISTYDATALKLQILDQNNQSISIAELDVLGVTGDNVDFRKTGETAEAAFGILSEDYKYGDKKDDVIRKGSLVFTGAYKGNPAYNAVILYNEKGRIVGETKNDDEGNAQQIILADVPDGSLITNVSNGTWVYWIDPEDIDNMVWPEKVRVELYRVNDALTNEGQRMVSDSLFETVAAKEKLSYITLSGNRTFNTEADN